MAIKVSGTTVIDGSRNIVNVGNVDGRDISVDGTKLDGIEAGADVTDATNVEAAGAVMDADIGVTVQAYSAVLAGTTASFTTADETKLGGIEAGADVTDAGNVDPLVDTHLNTGTASSGEFLSWTGSDYDWTTAGGAFSVIGTRNIIAISTLANLTTGRDNFAAGSDTCRDLTSGSYNIAIGESALRQGVTTLGSLGIGFEATRSIKGNYNVGIGYQALAGESGILKNAKDTVAIGYRAGYKADEGEGNVFVGHIAGSNVASGDYNTILGPYAGTSLTSGSNNFIGGYQAGASITTGSNNVAIGNSALDAATTGGQNIAIGEGAMGLGVVTAASGYNVAIGRQAGYDITSGTNNSLYGYRSGHNLTTGSNNVALGYASNDIGTTNSNTIVIGHSADPTSATVSNEITLGNSSIATLRSQVTTITSLSDARDKTDIQPLNAGLEFVEALNPVSFTWNMRDGGKVGEADTGFIAQDLKQVQEDLGVHIPHLVYEAGPDRLEAGYGKLLPILVQAIKDLSEKVDELETRIVEGN